ncbi:MAG: hypothetical protein GY810_27225 [Aureispira sp.]|nr:hypothetical protein [Aureispira sp.]
MKNIIKFLSLGLIAITLTIASCKKEPQKGNTTLNINHVVGTEALSFDEIKYTLAAGHSYSVSRLKYYISNVVLTTNEGAIHSVTTPFYCDAQDASTLSLDLGEVPAGTYSQISFTFGLNATTNKPNALSNTTENINMIWPISGEEGYHCMKLEGKYDSLSANIITKNYNIHTGPAGGKDNSITFSFPLSSMIVDGNNWTIGLTMDVSQWFKEPITYDFEDWGQMIMGNPNAQDTVKLNGANAFSLGNVSTK